MTEPHVVPKARIISGRPPELVVYDEQQPCPYLSGRVAELPLRIPARRLERDEFDERLENGDRRQGIFLYRTACPACQACEPIRIEVNRFVPNRSQRRAWQRAEREIATEIGEPLADEERVALYNRHKRLRGLSGGRDDIDLRGYREFLVMTCCETLELRYRVQGRLVGVALADRGQRGLSAVYCFYDPSEERLGIGTYSILKQIELCKAWDIRYLYLGLYIAECRTMAYKSRFLPHERLLDGSWELVER
jgi:arginyl-tRNA--protein-N-Asp/Glu arginylyltransferase